MRDEPEMADRFQYEMSLKWEGCYGGSPFVVLSVAAYL